MGTRGTWAQGTRLRRAWASGPRAGPGRVAMTTARTLGHLPDEAAGRWGDREALVFRDRRIAFRQLPAEVDRVAKGLIHLGVAPGEKVAIWLTNCPEWICAMFACAKIGAVHVPVNTRLRTADVECVLRHKAQLRQRALRTLGGPRAGAR